MVSGKMAFIIPEFDRALILDTRLAAEGLVIKVCDQGLSSVNIHYTARDNE